MKWFRALSVRCAIRLCFEHEDAVLGCLGRMGSVVEGIARVEEGEVYGGGGGGEREGARKRRKF